MPKSSAQFKASDLPKFSECLHFAYLERFGDPSLRRRLSEGELTRLREGQAHELKIISELEPLVKIEFTPQDFPGAHQKTLHLLHEGAARVYQGVLISSELLGIPDLLEKISKPSKLGDYSYQPVDIKNHKEVKKEDIWQLFANACMLEPILGFRPPGGVIWLNTGERAEVAFDGKLETKFFKLFDEVKKISQKDQHQTEPLRCGYCTECRWFPHCEQVWEKTDHVSLLTGVTRNVIDKLKPAGFNSCTSVADGDVKTLSEKTGITLKTSAKIFHSARARKENKPIQIEAAEFPKDRPLYFYDIETIEDTVYLHGLIKLVGGKRSEHVFFAEAPDQAEGAWHELLDFLAQESHPEPIIYCWTFFERGHVNTCWAKYGGNEKGYKILEKRLKDQMAFVQDHFALPCRGYSIKDVAPVFGFHWQAKDAGGMNCQAWYRDYLQTGDVTLKKKIIEYNLDDVRAMEVIDRELRKVSEHDG